MSQALKAGTTPRRRRAFMGLLDADGWGWASVKAFLWFTLIIVMLAYIPDRAYYFTVNRTLEVGLLAWSPVNFCPPENATLPCPAPGGSVVPWEPSPAELALPAARTAGSVAQIGTQVLYIGGSDGSAPTTTTYISDAASGTFSPWTAGPALPAPRSDTAVTSIGSSVYLIGGTGPDGNAVDTIWQLTYDQETKMFGAWAPVEGLTLPAVRAGAMALPVSDGLLIAGGNGADGIPQGTVWKSTLDAKGALGAFSEQAALLDPVAHGSIAQVGDFIWVWGGTDVNGPSGAVQRGDIGIPKVVETPAPDAVAVPLQLLQWAVSDAANMPPRSDAAGFSANGALYAVGGDDGSGPRNELYWTTPSATGEITDWQHLDQTDLPTQGLEGGNAIVTGTAVFVVGGETRGGIQSGSIRANLAPQPPFFRAGLVGAVVPALRIDGELGQQLGYLTAAGVGTVNGIILILIGWAYAHPATVRSWIDRRRRRS
ncbi:MAG: hypothetical protein HYX54_01045 [Chloroflexi bacterium]|nr:hypothetical protein [Chloroflexota bacterium]